MNKDERGKLRIIPYLRSPIIWSQAMQQYRLNDLSELLSGVVATNKKYKTVGMLEDYFCEKFLSRPHNWSLPRFIRLLDGVYTVGNFFGEFLLDKLVDVCVGDIPILLEGEFYSRYMGKR